MAKGKKTGGRSAGTVNKKTQSLIDICLEEGLDVFRAMVRIAKAGDNNMLKEVAQYVLPKRKAIEISGQTNAHVTFQKLDGTAERYSIGPKDDDDEV